MASMDTAESPMTADPVLRHFRQAVEKLFPGRVEQVILYGSRARGDARPDSDYDVVVVMRGYDGTWTEIDALADLGWDFLLEQGYDISALPLSTDEYRHGSILASEIKRDGIPL